MGDLERMLAEWLEYLDDEDGDLPFPEWAGETGWVQHDNGSLEDWGQYLLRLAHDEIAALKQKEIADDVRWMQIVYFVEKLRMNAVEGGMIAGWLDQLDEILTAGKQ